MIPHHVYYLLAVLGFLALCLMLHAMGSRRGAVSPPSPTDLTPPLKHPRTSDPTSFAGLTQRPYCAACEHAAASPKVLPPKKPEPMPPTRRRPRTVDTSRHFCPHTGCEYRGWLGLGNLHANGHPSGGPWRQFHCLGCDGYFPEHHGTIFHGKRTDVERLVHVLACLAEGLGIRATARVFAVDPNTVLSWLVEAAEQLQAFSVYFLCEVHLRQVQLDELYAVLRGVKDGEISDKKALKRLERCRHWVWTAIDPESKLLLTIETGPRTLAMAQRVVHQVVEKLAPSCVPLFLTDGFREYLKALLSHKGHWVQPARAQARGPRPQPRWMPLPELLYAQVVKSYRRRRLVSVKHRVVFGTLERVQEVLSACGWQISTAFVERLNLDIRQGVAAAGRRANTVCQSEEGLQHQLVVFQAYHNFVVPHASLRQRLPVAEPTNGTGSARIWRPRTPAIAAGLTDKVWSLKEVLLFRVPPWPQPQMG